MKKSTTLVLAGFTTLVVGNALLGLGSYIMKEAKHVRAIESIEGIDQALTLVDLQRKALQLKQEIRDHAHTNTPFLEVDTLIETLDAVHAAWNKDHGDGIHDETNGLQFIPVLLASLASSNSIEADLPFADVLLHEAVDWLENEIQEVAI